MSIGFTSHDCITGLVLDAKTGIVTTQWNIASFKSYEVAEAYLEGLSKAWDIFVEKFNNGERSLCGYLVGENPFDLDQQIVIDPNDSLVEFHIDEIKHLTF